MRIERVGMVEPRPMPTPAEMVEAIEWAGDFVTGMMADWPEYPVDPRRCRRRPPKPIPRRDRRPVPTPNAVARR